jgi:hypothetical protein
MVVEMATTIKPMTPAGLRRRMRSGCMARDIEAAARDERIVLYALRLLVEWRVLRPEVNR